MECDLKECLKEKELEDSKEKIINGDEVASEKLEEEKKEKEGDTEASNVIKAEIVKKITEKLAGSEKVKALGDIGLKTDQYAKQLAAMKVSFLLLILSYFNNLGKRSCSWSRLDSSRNFIITRST